MVDFLSPGVKVTEKRKGPITPLSTLSPGRAAFVGVTQKGPPSTPKEIFSESEYREIFGAPISGSYLYESVVAFFTQGGQSCYVSRVLHYTDLAVSTSFDAVAAVSTVTNGTSNALTMTASSPGTWGNSYKFTVTRVDTAITTAATIVAGSTSTIPLTSITRVNIGDTIKIVKGGDTQRQIVIAIDPTNKTVTFNAAITVPSGGYTGAEVVTNETVNLSIIDANGNTEISWTDLRMSALAGSKYIENAVNNIPNVSILANELALVPSSTVDPRPSSATTSLGSTTPGTAGGSIVDADYVGNAAGQTGLYALDNFDDFLLLAVPGVTSATVQNGIQTYIEGRKNIFAILETPQGVTPAAAKTHVQTTVNLATSFAAIYYPWVKASNPTTGGVSSYPPSGYVAGVYARTFKERNFGKAPAGIEDGRLLGVAGVDYEVKQPVYDTLYPAKINAILSKRGQGVVVFGSRTLDPSGEFLQISTRITFLVVAAVFRTGTEFANFEPNNKDTRERVVRYMESFLRSLRLASVLSGDSDDEAFFIICDSSNNTASVRRQGKLVCRVGLACESPAEFIDITLEQDTRAIDAELANELV